MKHVLELPSRLHRTRDCQGQGQNLDLDLNLGLSLESGFGPVWVWIMAPVWVKVRITASFWDGVCKGPRPGYLVLGLGICVGPDQGVGL